MALFVLVQHMKMFTCASKILLTANFSSIFFSVILLLLKFLLHHKKDQPFPVITQPNWVALNKKKKKKIAVL